MWKHDYLINYSLTVLNFYLRACDMTTHSLHLKQKSSCQANLYKIKLVRQNNYEHADSYICKLHTKQLNNICKAVRFYNKAFLNYLR